MMVMTILEAQVDRQNWQTLESMYKTEIQQLTPGIVQTYLVHNQKDETLWQIITIWESQEALIAMRQSGEKPRGVVMFEAAQAQPVLAILDVAVQAARSR